jgi:hypothetical protein
MAATSLVADLHVLELVIGALWMLAWDRPEVKVVIGDLGPGR